KQKHLSFGGRVTLIRSILTSIPIYFLSFFRIPAKVAAKLTQIQRRFLWGGGLDQKKIAWVKWETICLPKEKGGLGIKDITTFNRALLGKWRWNMMQQSSDLWAKILDSKYGGWRSLADGRRSSNGSLWWQDLMEVTHEYQLNNIIQQETIWKVGCGDKARFWEDKWTGDGEILIMKYPRLYQISSQQHQTVQQMGRHTDTAWEWNFRWRRPLFDCEIVVATRFLEDTTQIHIHPHLADCWKWRAEPNGQYTTRSAYLLMQGEATEENSDGVFTELWKLQIPAKAAIFAWRLIKDRLPTKLNLRRQIQLSDHLCPFCRNMEEDASHLFFNYPKTQPLW
ncbi:Putative ribonuclease H protein, partial [Glycine soja]